MSLGAGYSDLDGVERTTVTLAPGTGAVLLRTSAAAPPTAGHPAPPAKTETTIDPPTAPNVPTPDPARRLDSRTATPDAHRHSDVDASGVSGAPTASISARRRGQRDVRGRSSRVSGKRVKISGRVAGATSGKVKLVIQRKRQRRQWKTVARGRRAAEAGRLVREGTLTAAAGTTTASRRASPAPRPRSALALLLPHLFTRAVRC